MHSSKFPPLIPVSIYISSVGICITDIHTQILDYITSRLERISEIRDYLANNTGRIPLVEQTRLHDLIEDLTHQTTLSFYISRTALIVDRYQTLIRQSPQTTQLIYECVNEYMEAARSYIVPSEFAGLRDKCLYFAGLNTPGNHQTTSSYEKDPVGYSVDYAHRLAKNSTDDEVQFVKNTVRHPHNLRSLSQFYYTVSDNEPSNTVDVYRRRGKHHQERCKTVCPHCNNSEDFIIDANVYICCRCCRTVSEVSGDSTFGDIERVHLTSRYKYDRVDHFRDELLRHQGKQNSRVPQHIIQRITEIATNMNIIRQNATTDTDKFKDFTKFTMYQIMQVYRMSKYYHDINKIHYEITNIPPPDIHQYEAKLIDMVIKVLEIYDRIKPPQWKNFIQGQYIICQLMIISGISVKADDILLLRTWEKIREHDAIFRVICQILGWPFVALSSY